MIAIVDSPRRMALMDPHGSACKRPPIFHWDQWRNTGKRLPRPPCSEDRTQSPATVSRKREYFGMWPETLAISSRRWRNREAGDRSLNQKSPLLAGISPTIRDCFPEGGIKIKQDLQ